MPETPMNQEMQRMLPEAVKEVIDLYVGDQLANLLQTQQPEQRDQCWEETAKKFGPFSEKIIKLRQALKNAEVTKRAYPETLTNMMRSYFININFKDQMARELLTDLLFARITISPGYIDYSMKVEKEAQAMASELGIGKEKLGSKSMESVDLDKVVKEVLFGGLKLTRQT